MPLPEPTSSGRTQGTVAAFDRATRSGAVVLDDATRLRFGAEALADTRILHLRPGQRVTLTLVEGTVVRVSLLP